VKRVLGGLILFSGLALVMHALAQDAAPEPDLLKKADKLEKFEPKKVDEKEPDVEKVPRVEKVEPLTPAKQENPDEVLKRVQENMTASEKQLDKKDVGDKTRQIQQEILRDLDALINQAENQQNNGGGGKSKPSLGSKKSGASGSQNQAQKKPGGSQSGNAGQDSASSSGSKKDDEGKQASAGKKEGEGSPQAAKKEGKGEGKEQGGKKEGEGSPQQASNGKSGEGSGGGNAPEKKEQNTVADLFKDVWGHLPAAKRMEMDAYSREKFMGKYEDLLREYYRTIAERGRRGGN